MSLYFFRISTGRYSGAADQPYELSIGFDRYDVHVVVSFWNSDESS